MAIIYYYIESSKEEILYNGINLLEHYDQKVIVNKQILPCIKGLLTPRDEYIKYNSKDYICIEIETDIDDAYVINEDLNILMQKDEYYSSIVKLKEYKFGTYRNPKVLLINNIPSKNIKIIKEHKGFPIIFENSNDLYKNNIMGEFRHLYNDFDDTMLAVFFKLMSQKGRYTLMGKRILENMKTLYVYKDNSTSKIYSVCIKEGKNNG